MAGRRIDRTGQHRTAFEKNKKIILASQRICGICGNPVDFDFKFPHPLSPEVDHIIPIGKGGHPSDLSNLQLAHRWCNRAKSDKLYLETRRKDGRSAVIRNDDLPLHFDWANYQA